MPLTIQQKEALAATTRKLAMFGKFNARPVKKVDGEEKPNVVLSFTGNTLNAARFFEDVRPELRAFDQAILRIGDEAFSVYDLKTPMQSGDQGRSQRLSSDSPLLIAATMSRGISGGGVSGQTQDDILQALGGELFMKLVEDVDVVTRFSHPNFSRALLHLAEGYMLEYQNETSSTNAEGNRAKVDVEQWQQRIRVDHRLCCLLVQFLTSHTDDEISLLGELKTALRATEFTDNDTSTDKLDLTKLEEPQIDNLLQGLSEVKEVLLGSKSETKTWGTLALLGQNQGNFKEWLKDYPGNVAPDGTKGQEVSRYFGFNTGLENTPKLKNRHFMAYYRLFKLRSDSIHGLLRTEALHPFLFYWLASKYGEFGLQTIGNASRKMFDLGIARQVNKGRRVQRMSLEYRKLRHQKMAELTSNNDLYTGIESLQADDARRNARQRSAEIEEMLEPGEAYDYETLLKQTTEEFVFLSQLTGGTTKYLHQVNRHVEKRVAGVTQLLRNLRLDGTLPKIREVRDEILKSFTLDRLSLLAEVQKDIPGVKEAEVLDPQGLLTSVFDQLEQIEASNKLPTNNVDEFRNGLVLAFELTFHETAVRRFLENFKGKQDAIQAEKEKYESLFRLRNRLETQGKVSSGLAAVIVPLLVRLHSVKISQADAKKETTAQRGQMAARVVSSRAEATLPAMSIILSGSQELKSGQAGHVTQGGVQIGRVAVAEKDEAEGPGTSGRKTPVLTITPPEEVNVRSIPLRQQDVDAWEFHWDSDTPIQPVALKQQAFKGVRDALHERVAEAQRKAAADDRADETLIEDFDKLAEVQTHLHEAYVGRAANDAIKGGLQSLILGEYLMATPESASRLGHKGLSQILGIMRDMVRNLGTFDGAMLKDPKTTADNNVELSRRLEEINVSQYYPFQDGEEAKLSTVLHRYRSLCTQVSQGAIQGYLRELNEIKVFFDALEGSGLQVQFHNQTLGELTGGYGGVATQHLLYNNREPTASGPACVYLTKQNGSDDLRLLESDFQETFGDENLDWFLPAIFIADAPLESRFWPVVSSKDIKLNKPFPLHEAPQGWQNALNPFMFLAAAALNGTIKGRVKGTQEWLPDLRQLLARDQPGGRKLSFNTLPTTAPFPIDELFRHFWVENHTLLATLTYARWICLALQIRTVEGYAPAAFGKRVAMELNNGAGTALFGGFRGLPDIKQIYLRAEDRGDALLSEKVATNAFVYLNYSIDIPATSRKPLDCPSWIQSDGKPNWPALV